MLSGRIEDDFVLKCNWHWRLNTPASINFEIFDKGFENHKVYVSSEFFWT